METNNYLPPAPVAASTSRMHSNARIPGSDGVELVGDLYIPGGTPPFPAIVEITPYCAQAQARLGEIYAARGYLFLAVDARGRYRSGGHWDPMTHDQQDGHAVLHWLSAHPLCNGRIGTRGHSYCGYNQLLAAIDAPESLQAMVVCVAPGDPFDNVPFHGGAYDLNDFMWLMGMTGRTCADDGSAEDLGVKRFGADELDANPYEIPEPVAGEAEEKRISAWHTRADAALVARPFAELDLRFGVRHDTFREWSAHWRLDEYWRDRSAVARLDRSAVPTLHISGWWDLNGRGATTAFRAMRSRASTATARQAQRLLLGPWTHELMAPDCSDLPEDEAAQIERAAEHDELNDELAWFDRYLKDIPPGPSTQARTSLFVTGLYRWLDFEDWPPPTTQASEYFLCATTTDNRGKLLATPAEEGASESGYVFDPGDPTPYASPAIGSQRAPFDSAPIQRERRDRLQFETPALVTSMALVGEPVLLLYACTDAPDFDLYARVLDVYPDGRAIFLTDGILRARFRHGWDRPESVVPDVIQAYRIELWQLGHVLRTGHALRLEIASAAFRRFDVNPCTGQDLASDTGQRTARVRIQHSAEHASRLTLPVCTDARLIPEGLA